MLIEDFGRGPPAQDLAGPVVQRQRDGLKVLGTPSGQVSALREVLPQQWSEPRKLDTVMERQASEEQDHVSHRYAQSR